MHEQLGIQLSDWILVSNFSKLRAFLRPSDLTELANTSVDYAILVGLIRHNQEQQRLREAENSTENQQ
eukprot:12426256-Karenia_brevis.AAC.1